MFRNIVLSQIVSDIDQDIVDEPAYVSISDLRREIWGDTAEPPQLQDREVSSVQTVKVVDQKKQQEQEQKLQRYRELAEKRKKRIEQEKLKTTQNTKLSGEITNGFTKNIAEEEIIKKVSTESAIESILETSTQIGNKIEKISKEKDIIIKEECVSKNIIVLENEETLKIIDVAKLLQNDVCKKPKTPVEAKEASCNINFTNDNEKQLKNGDITKTRVPEKDEPTILNIKQEDCDDDIMEIDIEPSQICDGEKSSVIDLKTLLSTPIKFSEKFQCSNCPYWTKRKNVLEIHKKIHTKTNARAESLLTCFQCNFKTVNSKELGRHIIKYHRKHLSHVIRKKNNQYTSLQCDKCSYKAISNNDLILHKSAEHKDKKPALLKCPHCSFKTEQMTMLSNHLLCHKEGDPVRYRCDLCVFTSKNIQGLSRHQRTQHNGRRRYGQKQQYFGCDECDFISLHKTSLQYHKMTHQKEEESQFYKCDQCPHQTKFKWGLNAHKKTHLKAEERPIYGCDSCEYATFYKGNLKCHDEVVHRGLRISRKQNCEQCGFITRYVKKMKEHKKHCTETIKSEEVDVSEEESS